MSALFGHQLGKCEGASGHITAEFSTSYHLNGAFVISVKSGQPRVRETSFALGEARRSKRTWIDAKRGLVCCGSDMHDVKSPSTSCTVA